MKTLANISSFESLMNSQTVPVNNFLGFGRKKQPQYDFSSNEMWEAFNKERKRRMFVKKISALIKPTAELVKSAQNLQQLSASCTQSGGNMPYKNLKQFTDAWTKTWGVFAKAARTVQGTTKQFISQQQGAPAGNQTGTPAAPASGSPSMTAATSPWGNSGNFTVQDPGLAKPATPPPPQPDYGTTTTISGGEVSLPNGTVQQPSPPVNVGGGNPGDNYAFNPRGAQGTPAGGFEKPIYSDQYFSVR